MSTSTTIAVSSVNENFQHISTIKKLIITKNVNKHFPANFTSHHAPKKFYAKQKLLEILWQPFEQSFQTINKRMKLSIKQQ